jgi:protein tyrosine/serine phosphatase
MSFHQLMPGHWVDSDETNQALIDTATTSISIRTTSLTIEEDKSQPPTPDGTGLPTNFHMIGPGIYRSSYPQAAHFDKLKHYRFRTIITFVPEEIPPANLSFMTTHGITHHHVSVLANKHPHTSTPAATVIRILRLVMDKRNHPLLIHCNKGKHRTGCMTACFRKVTGWTDEACIAEYEKYAAPKDRVLDKEFIRGFDAKEGGLKAFALDNGLVGGAFAQPRPESSKDSEYTAGTVMSDQSRM